VTAAPARNVTPNLKASPSSLAWTSPDRIVFAANFDGNSGFGSVSATGGEVQTLWTGEELAAATSDAWGPGGSFSRDGAVTAVVRQSAGTPPEVWAGPIGKWKQITHLNQRVEPAWGAMRNIHWMNGSTRVQGWLKLPKDFDARQDISAHSQRARRTVMGVRLSLG
jgi:dipeptidyl aminopeptidase/acylaminoacyl peptidase